MMFQKRRDIFLMFFLLTVIATLAAFTLMGSEKFTLEKPTNIIFDSETNTLDFSSLTLEQKIAQMLIVYGKDSNREVLQNMLIGGVYLETKSKKKDFIKAINKFQDNSLISMIITADLEGCRNPFENFQEFPSFSEIASKEEAYQVGVEAGKLLKEMGFTMNLAPVVDLDDQIWQCRSFPGTLEEVGEKIEAYINGLQEEGILAVAKHYPGKTLSVDDSHLVVTEATIEEIDLVPFQTAMSVGVDAIMVSHLVVDGLVDSDQKPSIVSPELIGNLREEFEGLIITDEIGMLGFKNYYQHNATFTDFGQMFLDVFTAESDLILIFDREPERVYGMVNFVAGKVKSGEISEERIDRSVKRILEAKGIVVN